MAPGVFTPSGAGPLIARNGGAGAGARSVNLSAGHRLGVTIHDSKPDDHLDHAVGAKERGKNPRRRIRVK